MEAHTNADDATRYRSAAEVEAGSRAIRSPGCEATSAAAACSTTRPLSRRLDAEAEAQAAALRQRMNADTRHDPADLFRHVYAEPTPELRRQQRELLAELGRGAQGRGEG
jgi:2-oxoisovalerate dehydrogenase E1 component alpha subunit